MADGYPAVLMRIPDLARLDGEELQELVVVRHAIP
jgi:hypothetical protein